VFWMKRHGRTLKRDMERSLQAHTRSGNGWGIAVLVALAIAREGSETVIFLYGLGFGQSGHVRGMDVLAIVLGLGLAGLTFYILQLGGRIFSWRHFFRVTEIMLLLLAAGLLQTGVDKLIDKEILPLGISQVWNSSAIVDDSSPVGSFVAALTGYRSHPSLTNLAVYALFWLLVGLLMRRANRVPAGAAPSRAA
jgi:high-affinity iron transporter